MAKILTPTEKPNILSVEILLILHHANLVNYIDIDNSLIIIVINYQIFFDSMSSKARTFRTVSKIFI